MHYANQLVAGNTNGYLYRIDTSAGSPTCIQAQRLGGGTAAEGNPGGLTSPTIDVTNSKILVTTGDTAVGENKALAVYNLTFAAGEAPVAVAFLGAADAVPAQFPALDNDFWENNDGNIYAIGTASTTNTLLMRVPYNGATLLTAAGPRGAAPQRRGGQRRHQPGGRVPHRRRGEQPGLHLHRRQRHQLQLHEPHLQRVQRHRRIAGGDVRLVRAAERRLVGHQRRHPNHLDDRDHCDREHLLRHRGRQRAEHDCPARSAVLKQIARIGLGPRDPQPR